MFDNSISDIEAVIAISLLSGVIVLLNLWFRSRKAIDDYRNILDHQSEPILRIDIDRLEPRFCNRAFSKLMGYKGNAECISLFNQGPHLPQQNFYQIYRLCTEGRMPNIIMQDCNGKGIHHTVSVDIDQENQSMDIVLRPKNIHSGRPGTGYGRVGSDRSEQDKGSDDHSISSGSFDDTLPLLELLYPEMGSWEMDLVAGIYNHNDLWLEHLGYQGETNNNQMAFWESITAPADVLLLTDAINNAEDRVPFAVTHKLANRRGVERTIDTRGSVIHRGNDGTPQIIRGIHKDVTGEDYVEEEPGQDDTQIVGADRHELMNQLATIKGYSELIVTSGNNLDAAREFASEVLQAAERASRLVSGENIKTVEGNLWLQTIASEHDLQIVGYQYSRPEFEARFIVSAIEYVLAFMDSENNSKSQYEIEIASDTDFPCSACAASLESDFSSISISAPGISFSQSHFKHLLDEGYSTTQFRAENKLFAVSKIMHENNGHVQVVMNESGFTVRLILPRSTEPVPTIVKSENSTGEILIIDDDPAVASYLNEIVQRAGFTVATFNDPLLALEYYRDQPAKIDLVITDQTMSELSGEVLIQSLHKLTPELPVIVCSGQTEADMANNSLLVEAAAFITKPVDVALLLHTINENLEVLDSDG
jgi:CheY-like chemotaxis protein